MAEPTTKSKTTRQEGFTKPDGTTGTHDVFVDPDGNVIPYTAGSVLVIPAFEQRLQEASLRADQDDINDIQEEYQKAREKAVQRLHDRAAKAQRDNA